MDIKKVLLVNSLKQLLRQPDSITTKIKSHIFSRIEKISINVSYIKDTTEKLWPATNSKNKIHFFHWIDLHKLLSKLKD